MFSGQLPHYVEPRKLAQQGGEISGHTTVGALPRLAEFRDSQQSPVSASLYFSRDDDGHQVIQGEIDTRLHLTCQRCLELVEKQIHAEVSLAMVWSEDAISGLPEAYEPWLLSDEKLVLADLLEEELLLALPLAPVHEECPVSLPNPAEDEGRETGNQDAENPFAVLATLKSRRGRE